MSRSDANANLINVEQVAQSSDWLTDLGLRATLQSYQRDLCRLSDSLSGPDGDDLSRVEHRDHVEQRLWLLAQLVRTTKLIERALDLVETSAASRLAVLSREADHRIRNSLHQVIGSLHFQAAQTTSDEVKKALQLAGARIHAIAQIHTALASPTVSSQAVRTVEVTEYLHDLCAVLRNALVISAGEHLLQLEAESYRLTPEDARAIGVIVTELVANAVQHAFVGKRPGVILVLGALRRDGQYQISVQDNGAGLPPAFDLRLRVVGTGLRIVSLMADKLKARLTADGTAGARFTLTLPPNLERRIKPA